MKYDTDRMKTVDNRTEREKVYIAVQPRFSGAKEGYDNQGRMRGKYAGRGYLLLG